MMVIPDLTDNEIDSILEFRKTLRPIIKADMIRANIISDDVISDDSVIGGSQDPIQKLLRRMENSKEYPLYDIGQWFRRQEKLIKEKKALKDIL